MALQRIMSDEDLSSPEMTSIKSVGGRSELTASTKSIILRCIAHQNRPRKKNVCEGNQNPTERF